jgi:peptide/nickel transport system permease protein
MRNYIIRRVLLMIPTLILVSLVVFFTIRLIPGSVLDLMVQQHASATTGSGQQMDLNAMKQLLGLDKPIFVQYGLWLNDMLHGNFGHSLWSSRSLSDELALRLPVTFELGLLAFIIAQIIALPIGLLSAVRQDSIADFLARSFAIIGLSVPGFWLGTLVMVFPAIWWGWSPPLTLIPFTANPLGNLEEFAIPAFLVGLGMAATTMRMLRTTMLEVLRQDYVRTAWSKGLKERIVVVRHGLRNALIPVVTVIAGQIPVMIGGVVIIEQIFSLPGMGRLFLDSINQRDYPMVSGINIFLAAAGMVIILLTDLSYAYLDPRIRYK